MKSKVKFIAFAYNIAIVGRARTTERANKKRSEELIPKMKQRKIRPITLHVAIEQSPT